MGDDGQTAWRVAPLGDVALVQLGKTPKKVHYRSEGPHKIIKFRDLANGEIKLDVAKDGFVATDEEALRGLRDAKAGDVLVTASAHSGESIGRKCGLVPELPESFEGVYYVGELLRVRVDPDEMVPEWAFLFFSSKDGIEAVQAAVAGVHLTQGRARQIPIPLPPKDVQRARVAEASSLLARLVAATERLALVRGWVKRARRSLLQKALRGELTHSWREQHPDIESAEIRLERVLGERRTLWGGMIGRRYVDPREPGEAPDLPASWSWVTVAQLAVVQSGDTPKGISEITTEQGDVPWFKVGDMNLPGNEREMSDSRTWLSNADADRLKLRQFPPGTVAFPKRGGAIATNKKRRLGRFGALDLNTMAIAPVDEVDELVGWWFESVDLGALADGSNVPQINHPDIEELELPLPPAEEELEIVARVDAAGKLLDRVEERLALAQKRLEVSREVALSRYVRAPQKG